MCSWRGDFRGLPEEKMKSILSFAQSSETKQLDLHFERYAYPNGAQFGQIAKQFAAL